MSKTYWFLQCKLARPGVGQSWWVPEKLAVEGKRLRFTEDEPDGPVWTVEAVYSTRLNKKEALDNRRDALKRFQGVLVHA